MGTVAFQDLMPHNQCWGCGPSNEHGLTELGHVVDGAARGRELEVEQRNRDAVTEDDVLGAHVVVAHEHPARRVSQTGVPGETLRVEPAGGVVQPAQQPGDGRQRGVGLAPVRIGRDGDLAVDEHEALASVLVDADW
jgi:hypothetical protein